MHSWFHVQRVIKKSWKDFNLDLMIPNPNSYQLWKKEVSSRSFIKVSNSRPDAWHGYGTLEKSLSKLYPSQKQWSRFVSPTSAAGISVRYKKRCQKSFFIVFSGGKVLQVPISQWLQQHLKAVNGCMKACWENWYLPIWLFPIRGPWFYWSWLWSSF